MAKQKKVKSISQVFNLAIFIPGGLMALTLLGGLLFAILYAYNHSPALLFALAGYVIIMVILYSFICANIVNRMKVVFRDGLYGSTDQLIKDLGSNQPSNVRYPEGDIKELKELNTELAKLQVQFNNATLISADLSKANIPLEYVDKSGRIVTLESFKQNLDALIYSAQNYRNVIVEVFYDLEEEKLSEEEKNRLLRKIQLIFADYKQSLFMVNDSETGFFIFIPYVDTFSRINEQLTNAIKDLSISKKTYDGLTSIHARFSLVCYPYSDVSELFPDLRYAKRQGQNINFYFPNRLSSISENIVMQNSVNLNHMTKIMESLSTLSISTRDNKSSMNTIRRMLKQLATYLKVDYAGLFVLDDTIDEFVSEIQTNSENSELFKEGDKVQRDFIDILEAVRDPDDSYYFSERNHANVALARYIDRIDIASGFYYSIHNHDKLIAIVYFFNKNRPFMIDSYIRESLFMFSYRIGDYLIMNRREASFNETYKEINSILMTSDYSLYRIDPSNYELVSFSEHFTSIFKKAAVGEKCYKALYGLDAPCNDCPLKTMKKKLFSLEGDNFETSLSLNEKRTKLKRLLVHHIKDEISTDRFDPDLLINSYRSLLLSLRNYYTINSRGYLLVLRIDNVQELVKELGSEGYLYALRQFIQEIKDNNRRRNNIYYFDQTSISILMAELGQIDVVNFCEKIYDLSKKKYVVNDKEVSFNVTYLPYNFPQSFPNAEDFLKYTIRHLNTLHFETNQDKIIFPDGEYTRSASRKDFMLAVIDEQFGNKTFSVALQPMVRAYDKSIFGAEIFLRLSDDYRKMVFSADELIKVAAQYGKISLISNALINYIGELYQQFGLTIFKVFGFTRLTINTDFSYFDDPNFFNDIYELLISYHFPRDFLGFEITEYEVMTHLDKFKNVAKGILNQHIALICDQYSGQYLSIEKLKELGFSEIKIGRNLVMDIETNPKHLNEVTLLMNEAKNHDMKVTLVGVENSDQYVILRDIDKKCALQGYHFYKPLDKIKFIEELRKNS